jgi:hypothetical protein
MLKEHNTFLSHLTLRLTFRNTGVGISSRGRKLKGCIGSAQSVGYGPAFLSGSAPILWSSSIFSIPLYEVQSIVQMATIIISL